MKTSKYYKEAYNNYNRYKEDINNIISRMEKATDDKLINIYLDQVNAIKKAEKDNANGTYKFI